jgi:hypothetical protein
VEYQPGGSPGQHGPVPTAGSRGTGQSGHGDKGMRDRALAPVQPAEIERYVVHVDGDRRNQGRDIEPARHIKEARQDEQAQRRGGQMGDFIERAGAQQAERNPAVDCVKSQRDPRQQDLVGQQT